MTKKRNNQDIASIALTIAIICFGIGLVTAVPPTQPYTLYGTATLNGKALTAQDDDVISLKVDGVELVSYTMGDISGTDNYVLKVPMDSDASVTTAAQEGDSAYIYINGVEISEGVQVIGAPATVVTLDISATSASNPPSTPTLNDPGTTDTDGSYTVSWSSVSGATSYTLEEDTSSSFSSPSVVHSGAGTSKDVSGKIDGTYYYRVKACNAESCSGWSNVEDIEVSIPHEEEGWKKTFGGPDNDVAYSVQKTSDGGYILAGYTDSYGAGDSDFWLLKTDSSGKEQWNETFGGTEFDIAYSVAQTADGGYIIAGYTFSYGVGGVDFWLVKTDANGNEQWDKTFGGTAGDYVHSVQQTADGGYILAGYTSSYGAGLHDFWLVKTDANGNELWNKTFGGPDAEGAEGVLQAADGGYILAGYTDSFGAGSNDFWLVKTDSNGKEQWNKTFGGPDAEGVKAVLQTTDGGYILAGYTDSFGAGSADFWLIKVKEDGATSIFDTRQSENPYPSIPGTHTGTSTPNQDITVQKLYTYPCAGTGGHTQYVRIYGDGKDESAFRTGYTEDRDTITFDSSFTLEAGKTYHYVIETGSYPQIHPTKTLQTENGWINCTKFTDANGKEYDAWIPAIRLFG